MYATAKIFCFGSTSLFLQNHSSKIGLAPVASIVSAKHKRNQVRKDLVFLYSQETTVTQGLGAFALSLLGFRYYIIFPTIIQVNAVWQIDISHEISHGTRLIFLDQPIEIAVDHVIHSGPLGGHRVLVD